MYCYEFYLVYPLKWTVSSLYGTAGYTVAMKIRNSSSLDEPKQTDAIISTLLYYFLMLFLPCGGMKVLH